MYDNVVATSQYLLKLVSQLVVRFAKFLYISGQPLTMAFYLLFLFPTNLEAHITMALAHHPTPVLPIGNFWCLYPTNFP